MKYISTRNGIAATSAESVSQGLAPDGGLLRRVSEILDVLEGLMPMRSLLVAAFFFAAPFVFGAECPLISFLALTGRPTDADIERKVEVLSRDGIDQFMLYGRSGLEYEYLGDEWFRMLETFCAAAEKRGKKVWLYDEFCWPSGSCNKRILRENDEWRLNEKGVWRDVDGGLHWERAFSAEAGNTFDPEATHRFVELTHEVYYARLKPYFDRKVIVGIFTDEPGTPIDISFQHRPLVRFAWWRGLDEEYAAATGGRSLTEDVEAFVRDETKAEVWAVYLQLKAKRFREAFFGPINEWCRKACVESTGHLTEELCMSGGPLVQGDLLKVLKTETLPGVDEIFTNTETNDIEWITLAAAQHAALRRKGGPGALAELFAIGPNDMSAARMRQMVWIMALHCVDHYLVSMEVMDHKGLKEKHAYLSSIQEGQPWRPHFPMLAEESGEAVAFSRQRFCCDVAVRYPQHDAAVAVYRNTHGTFQWNTLKGPELRPLLSAIRSRQLDCDLIEETEQTDSRFVFRIVDGGYVEERTSKRFASARTAVDWLLGMVASSVRVYEQDGGVADELMLRQYRDGSAVMVNLRSSGERKLFFERDGVKSEFVMPGRGVVVVEPGSRPQLPVVHGICPLGVETFALSIDRDNVHRHMFSTNGICRFTVAPGTPAVRFAVREWPTRAMLELDGRPLVARAPCVSLPIEYRPLYRETETIELSVGTHEVKAVSNEDDRNYFMPVALSIGHFATNAHGLRPLPTVAAAGPLSAVGLGEFVGEVVYRARVKPPLHDNVRLLLPSSQAFVRVRWNGRDIGVRAWSPYEWSLPPNAAGTEGELEIAVPTAVVNMCGDAMARSWDSIWCRARDRVAEGLATQPVWIW